jgi:bifunctional N-acetylglucosamine-1-phosphate-uridyltransferase/glucosamine-1-phosphate-acetyltransferase GlmU-like protein
VISEDVPDRALGIERTEQKNVLDYKKKKSK